MKHPEIPWSAKRVWINHVNPANRLRSPSQVFTGIYEKNSWKGSGVESPSGPGSSLRFTESMRGELPDLFDRYGIRTMIDAGCGDFNWMRLVDMSSIEQYTGFDVVPQLVDTNTQQYGNDQITFAELDVTRQPLPYGADLILCRDMLFHLSFRNIRRAVSHFQESGSTYLLTTSHMDHQRNKNIVTGGFRLLNLEAEPFNFTPAVEYFIDRGQYPEGHKQYQRHLGLWKLSDLLSK